MLLAQQLSTEKNRGQTPIFQIKKNRGQKNRGQTPIFQIKQKNRGLSPIFFVIPAKAGTQNSSFLTASLTFSSAGVPRAPVSRLSTPVPGGRSA